MTELLRACADALDAAAQILDTHDERVTAAHCRYYAARARKKLPAIVGPSPRELHPRP